MSYRFEDNTPQFFDSVRSAADSAINDMANRAYNKAKNTSAFSDRTGNLRGSITKVPSKFKNGGFVIMAGGGQEYYARFIEFGTKKMSPKPFMRPANEEAKQMEGVLVSALKRVVK